MHSCNASPRPLINTRLSTFPLQYHHHVPCPPSQLLVYRAIRPIAPGDAISHAYVNHTLPTLSRRALLYAGKDFVCMCCVCLGPDFARPLLCGGASSGATGDVVGSSSSRDDSGQCRGTMLNTDAGTDEPDVWHCSHCGPRSDAACSAALALEAALEARLRVMQRDDCPASSLADIHALAAEASASLSPEHSLVRLWFCFPSVPRACSFSAAWLLGPSTLLRPRHSRTSLLLQFLLVSHPTHTHPSCSHAHMPSMPLPPRWAAP